MLRHCYHAQYLTSLHPPNAGERINYDKARRDSSLDSAPLELQISTNANTLALVDAVRNQAQQIDGLILANTIITEKLGALEAVQGLSGYQDMAKKVVSRVMATEHLRSGRGVAGVPFRNNTDVHSVLTVTRNVQKISCVVFAHIAWDKVSFIYQLRNLLLHPTYCATHYWGAGTDKYFATYINFTFFLALNTSSLLNWLGAMWTHPESAFLTF